MQGGFIPDVVLYLSYYYTTNECKCSLFSSWDLLSRSDCSADPHGVVLGIKLCRRDIGRVHRDGYFAPKRGRGERWMEVPLPHRGWSNFCRRGRIVLHDAPGTHANEGVVQTQRVVH